MIDMTESFTKEDAKKNKSEGIVLGLLWYK